MLDDISTGASNDIKHATKIARSMVAKYGMSENLGLVSYESEGEVFLGRDYGHSKMYSEKYAALIDEEVRKIISQLYDKTKTLLENNKNVLEDITNALLEKETLNEQEFEKIYYSSKA